MKRRSTLGPLSPSQANAQRAGAVARPSIKGDGDMPKARRSLAPGKDAGERRYSQERRRSHHSRANKPDPRNLSDKAFQHAAVRTVIACLTSLGYNQQVTPKNLTLPSAKDFNSIARFLMHEVDPDYQMESKLEDELPAFLQMQGYPYPLSKSSLVTVGAPHTWPHVLGALAWMADMISYSKRADDEAAVELVPDIQFAMEAGDMYERYMENDDNAWRAEMDRQLQMVGAELEEVAATIEEACQGARQVEDEIRNLRTRPGPVQLAREELLQAENKHSKSEAALRNNTAALKQAQRRVQEEAANETAKASQLAALEKEVQELVALVAAQPLNKLEVESMMRLREERSQRLTELNWKLKEVQAEERTLASRWQKHVEELKLHVEQYNQLAYRLKLTPEDAKRAKGTSLELRILAGIDGDGRGTQIVNLDLKGQVCSLLDKIDREMDARTVDAIRQQGEAKIEHDREMEKVARLKVSLELLQKQVEEANHSCDEVVANTERVVQERQRDAQGLQADSSHIDTQLQQELEGREQERAQLEHDQLQYEQQCRDKVAALGRELAAAKEVVRKGKAEAMAQLLASAQKARELRRRVETTPRLAQLTLHAECRAILDRQAACS